MRINDSKKPKKEKEFTQVRVIGKENMLLLNEVCLMMQDPASLHIVKYPEVVAASLKVMRDHLCQLNGAKGKNPLFAHVVKSKKTGKKKF